MTNSVGSAAEIAKAMTALREQASGIPHFEDTMRTVTNVQAIMEPLRVLSAQTSVSPRLGTVYYASTTVNQ